MTKNWIMVFSCWLLTIGCGAQRPTKVECDMGQAIAYEREYTKEDSALVVKLLREAKTERGTENRVFYFGKKFLGLPYVAHTLELGDTEHLIVNLHGLDCTTFVETVVALSMCDQQDKRTFGDYCKNLSKIRFREGKMTDYTSRLHYFTWWAEDNEQLGIVEDIAPQSEPWGAFTAVQAININYMSAHPTPQEESAMETKHFIECRKRWRHRCHADRQRRA